ncbi:hypothetical protein [Brevundimonas sp.]|uniref:hypothetical protein n=1 Tax=Brevundimonas sp. TaxID=1871086 RepID=UPI002ED80739
MSGIEAILLSLAKARAGARWGPVHGARSDTHLGVSRRRRSHDDGRGEKSGEKDRENAGHLASGDWKQEGYDEITAPSSENRISDTF